MNTPTQMQGGAPSETAHPGNSWYLVKRGLYYRPNAAGYTSEILEAGIFSEAVALSHVGSTAGEKSADMRVKMVRVPRGSGATETDLRVKYDALLTESATLHAQLGEARKGWDKQSFDAQGLELLVNDITTENTSLKAHIGRLQQREGELEMLLAGGAGRIARERHRHVTQEGYDAAHDDLHTYGTIRVVAAMLACKGTDASVADPLDRDDWNLGRHPLERRLEIAGALLAAELDRLERAALQSVAKEGEAH